MKKFIIIVSIVVSSVSVPAYALTQAQVNAVLGLLSAFGVEQSVVSNVSTTLQATVPIPVVIPSTPTSDVSNSNTPPTLSISLEKAVVTLSCGVPKIHIEWSTSIPSSSKIFLTATGIYTTPLDLIYLPATTPQITNSTSGISTMHFLDIGNLNINYQYSYTIEAIAGFQDQKLNGTFSTKQSEIPVQPTTPCKQGGFSA